MKKTYYICDVCGNNIFDHSEKKFGHSIIEYGDTHVCSRCEEHYEKLKKIKAKTEQKVS